MAVGKHKREREHSMWGAVSKLPRSVGHRFYEKLDVVLGAHGFDDFVESHCRRFYTGKLGRPRLAL
jgi:transposase